MKEYRFDKINARFIAAGAGVQAKGMGYRLRLNKDRDAMRQEDYGLTVDGGLKVNDGDSDGKRTINEREARSEQDYWLGRSALTDVAIDVPDEGVLVMKDVVVNVSLQKEIVSTALVGRKGSVKEYISDGDYQLSMSVGIVATGDGGEIIDQYPERAVEQLRKILEIGEALEVHSVFLELFGITHIVVTGFSAGQMTQWNRQEIEITAVSDTPYIIKSTEY